MNLGELCRIVAEATAECYIDPVNHGDYYYFPVEGCINGKKGLHVAFFTREALLNALHTGRIYNVFGVVDNVLKLEHMTVMAMRKAFGPWVATWYTGYNRYNDLPKDPNCPAAPRARTFEKLGMRAADECFPFANRWMGGLNNSQIDGVSIYVTADGIRIKLEGKGFRGKLQAFSKADQAKEIYVEGL